MFPPTFDRKNTVLEIKTKYAEITHDKSAESVTVAGRIYIVRNHGKTIFADLGDESGKIQLYIRKNDLGEEQFELFNQYRRAGRHYRGHGSCLPDETGRDHHLGGLLYPPHAKRSAPSPRSSTGSRTSRSATASGTWT